MAHSRAAEGFTGTRMTELEGELLALSPTDHHRMMETSLQKDPVECTMAFALQVHPNGDWAFHGETPIFWQYVRKELEKADDEFPWVVGRLVRGTKGNKPYLLSPPTPEEQALIDGALDEFIEQGGPGEPASTEEEPF